MVVGLRGPIGVLAQPSAIPVRKPVIEIVQCHPKNTEECLAKEREVIQLNVTQCHAKVSEIFGSF